MSQSSPLSTPLLTLTRDVWLLLGLSGLYVLQVLLVLAGRPVLFV